MGEEEYEEREQEEEEEEEEEEIREIVVQKAPQQVVVNPNDDPNVLPRSQEEGQGEGGAQSEVNSEWEVCVGDNFFFDDLPPFAEWDPRVIPDSAAYSADELRGNVACEQNPFDLTSFWVDRTIQMGHVDEEVCYLLGVFVSHFHGIDT